MQGETGCSLLDTSVPVPKTAKHFTKLKAQGSIPPRIDKYLWLRDDARNDSAVLSHLQEENAYAEAVLAPTLPLQQLLLEEMLARIPQEESSVPQRQGRHWWLYSVHRAGMQYRRYCRRRIDDPQALPSEFDTMNLSQPEVVLLDQDELAAGHSFFDMAGPSFSPDEHLVAYGVDTAGSEVYTLFVRNLTSGHVLVAGSNDAYTPEFRMCAGDFVFLDNRQILFTTLTEDTHRPDKVWLFHLWSTPTKAGRTDSHRRVVRYVPRLLYQEKDEAFHLGLWRSRSDSIVYLRGSSDTTHYLYYMSTNSSGDDANFTILAPKVHEHEYMVRDGNGFLYAVIGTPEERNGQLVVVELGPNALLNATADSRGRRRPSNNSEGSSSSSSGKSAGGSDGSSSGESSSEHTGGNAASSSYWALLQPHSRTVEIVDLAVSSRWLAVLERKNGTLAATAYPLPADGKPLAVLRDGKQFAFQAPSYALEFGDQGPFSSHLLRVRYSSLTHPSSVYDINMETGNRVLKQQQEVVGYDSSQYHSRLLWASSTDGAQVPISLVYRGELVRLDGSDPLLLEAYGGYGASFDPEFSGSQLSLLDRGFVCAIAHVRGGGELGRYWYQDGKLMAKNNSFNDLAAAADFLIKAKYTSADKISAWGRSAGGLTVAATINRRANLFKAAILDVPFVDVVTTMSDPSLPLTVIEVEEWGCCDATTSQAAYENVLSFSPLDNVAAQPYPHLLLTGGLNDPRVGFWEPAKMAAKVRELKTSNSLVLLETNMAAGHFANSGLEGRLKERAFKFAFLLQTVAPCATMANQHTELGARCRGCFAALVAAATTIALVTLVVVLRPSSRIARKWRRLGGWSQAGRQQISDNDEDEGDGGEGFDTRLYAVHMSDSQAAEAADAEAEQQRQARQRQLEQQGLSLTSYDAVRNTVRDRLLPIPSPSSAALPVAPPMRRISVGTAAEPCADGVIELSRLSKKAGGELPISS